MFRRIYIFLILLVLSSNNLYLMQAQDQTPLLLDEYCLPFSIPNQPPLFLDVYHMPFTMIPDQSTSLPEWFICIRDLEELTVYIALGLGAESNLYFDLQDNPECVINALSAPRGKKFLEQLRDWKTKIRFHVDKEFCSEFIRLFSDSRHSVSSEGSFDYGCIRFLTNKEIKMKKAKDRLYQSRPFSQEEAIILKKIKQVNDNLESLFISNKNRNKEKSHQNEKYLNKKFRAPHR